ncbi:uncharacterized protein BO96DRAFT_353246 [Aspergillus niger CBS 101883]|uniref:Uncharacterized protein n=2 Tax=Aspergillus niger TaxID=5061 RepID=A2QSL0_ASPNC|nr:uncharacterized protein BO96DRAFT_353246 [Aspergillus niger CBS 101883]XP_059604197.1 hypothetical protein An08g11110 [Aspergillus niger]PYH50144.1 hypothetical protein BO96DRAFT_353246 [Aspergillus niger CBS 101883]CAK45782.1 hypothetical protein An08g11110 [Aspergillus niger]
MQPSIGEPQGAATRIGSADASDMSRVRCTLLVCFDLQDSRVIALAVSVTDLTDPSRSRKIQRSGSKILKSCIVDSEGDVTVLHGGGQKRKLNPWQILAEQTQGLGEDRPR